MALGLKIEQGEFKRTESTFRNWITASGESGFPAEANRYHLYVSYACPWAHRALIYLKLKGLEDIISVSVVHPVMPEESWTFAEDFADATGDTLYGLEKLRDIYLKADPHFSGLVTVPVLWDKKQQTIVNNESSEIIRMLNSAFDAFAKHDIDLYPQHLAAQIDEINAMVYDKINNGVYKTGFASSQQAYLQAYNELFAAMDELEQLLASQRYLVGDVITEADWRLFTTLVRFDAVYYGHFKTNKKRLLDYPNLWGYTKELYQIAGIADTVNMAHIKTHYYASHRFINPTGIVPAGPELDFYAPHGRGGDYLAM